MEPPIGPVVTAAIHAGDRLRWRRRIAAAAAVAGLTAVAITVPAFALGAGPALTSRASVHGAGTAFIETSGNTVVAVNLVTGRAGRPIRLPGISLTDLYGHPMATAPDGQTVWVMRNTELTPINVRTDQAGRSVRLYTPGALGALITDRGSRAYVALSPHGLLVVNLADRQVLSEIMVPACQYLVPSPDGRLIYGDCPGKGSGVAVISTTTNTVLRSVSLGDDPYAIAVAPDSTTAYAFAEGFSAISHGQTVGPFTLATRIDASTGAARTIKIRNTEAGAMAPNGSLIYAAGQHALYAVSPVSGKAVGHWPLPERSVSALAVSPDGATAYALGFPLGRSQQAVLAMVNLRTGRVERLVHLPYRVDPNPDVVLQVSPDGQTVYAELQKSLTASYAVAVDAGSGRIIAMTPVHFSFTYPVAFAR
jgi:DNA-binding beta-propeller fold protein YncE